VTRPAALLAAALAAAALSCVPFQARAPRPGPFEGEWAEIRDRASRRVVLYDGLVHRATATATYLAPGVRAALARRLAVWEGWHPPELEARLDEEARRAAEGEEFVLVLYTAESRQNDLDKREDSIWRVAVELDSGEDLLPVDVEVVPPSAQLTALYPWVSPFETVYRLRFPVPQGRPLVERPFFLELGSAVGYVLLDFREEGRKLQLPRAVP
jgi:hypothetical protein